MMCARRLIWIPSRSSSTIGRCDSSSQHLSTSAIKCQGLKDNNKDNNTESSEMFEIFRNACVSFHPCQVGWERYPLKFVTLPSTRPEPPIDKSATANTNVI
eukprot:1114180-Rhodomonas_salina.1